MPQNNMVTFNSILVNTLNSNSGIFVGTNSQYNWSSNSNNKSGFGSILGAGNAVSRGVNIFMDNDLIDTPILSNNYTGTALPPGMKAKDDITIYGYRRPKGQQSD